MAERAIQTWKDHFVGVLIGTNETFTLHLWCQVIPQDERQLLLLQQSCINPKISAYAHVYGSHDYNVESFFPIGMESLVHEKPKKRRNFSEQCSKGWVLGTSFEHYYAWTMWMKTTRALRISATIFHKHKYISNPSMTPADLVLAATGALAKLLTTKVPNSLTNTSMTQLGRLGSILKPEVPVPEGRADGNLKHLTVGLNVSAKITIALPPTGTQPPNFPRVSPCRLLAVEST